MGKIKDVTPTQPMMGRVTNFSPYNLGKPTHPRPALRLGNQWRVEPKRVWLVQFMMTCKKEDKT